MARYLFYFHYWLMPDEPIETVIDFDPQDKATTLIPEIHEEISYHTGIDPEPDTFIFVELYGLRPFNPKAWDMSLKEFVGYYGNSFVIINMKRPDLGDIEFIRPKQIAGGQRSKFYDVGIENDSWDPRAQFEVRLVSSLIRWFQFFRKSKWLLALPLDGQKNDYRVWKVSTEIPESNYSAQWRIILPYTYPNDPPKLFISKKDVKIAINPDLSHIWKDSNGEIFYYLFDVNEDSTQWDSTHFVVDFLLSGLWNFLVRSLYKTFPDLLFYKANVGNKYIITEAPPEAKSSTKWIQSKISDPNSEEGEDVDYRVEIAEISEEIDYNENVSLGDDFDESEGKSYLDHEEDYGGFEDDSSGVSTPSENNNEEENDGVDKNKEQKEEGTFNAWVINSTEDEARQYGNLFTWLLLRTPEKALKDLTKLVEIAPDHLVYKYIEWSLIKDDFTSEQLFPFAKYIINQYLINSENGLIFDTDREFLRETVLKKWKELEKVNELRESLKKNVHLIKKVTYETLEV